MFWNEIWLCKKHKTFYYCFDDYPLREADLAGWWMEAGRINIINLDIMMRGLDLLTGNASSFLLAIWSTLEIQNQITQTIENTHP